MSEEIHELLNKYFQSNLMGERQETILEISRRLKALDKIFELSHVMVETGKFSTKTFDNFLEDIEKAEYCFKETKSEG